MAFEEEYNASARKLRLLSVLNEREDVHQNSLSANMIEAATEAQAEGLVQIMDSDLILMLPSGKEALNASVEALQRYMKR